MACSRSKPHGSTSASTLSAGSLRFRRSAPRSQPDGPRSKPWSVLLTSRSEKQLAALDRLALPRYAQCNMVALQDREADRGLADLLLLVLGLNAKGHLIFCDGLDPTADSQQCTLRHRRAMPALDDEPSHGFASRVDEAPQFAGAYRFEHRNQVRRCHCVDGVG